MITLETTDLKEVRASSYRAIQRQNRDGQVGRIDGDRSCPTVMECKLSVPWVAVDHQHRPERAQDQGRKCCGPHPRAFVPSSRKTFSSAGSSRKHPRQDTACREGRPAPRFTGTASQRRDLVSRLIWTASCRQESGDTRHPCCGRRCPRHIAPPGQERIGRTETTPRLSDWATTLLRVDLRINLRRSALIGSMRARALSGRSAHH